MTKIPRPKKRCPALSPGGRLQCELKRGHLADTTLWARHRVMNIYWSPGEGTQLPSDDHPTPEVAGNSGPLANETTWQELGLTAEARFNTDDLQPLAPEEQLRHWWFNKAADEIDVTVPKAVEYGSTDLIDIGLMLARTMRREVTEEEAAELGVFFYLIGKIARWQSAIERGERPSDDTLLDIGVYVRMAQRIRDAGGWPGIEQSA